MNQNDQDQYGYQDEHGQDHYAEGEGYEAQGEYVDEGYDENQVPVREGRSFFQKNANLIIFGGVGIFALVMGYINFGSMLFPKNNTPQTAQGVADPSALLKPQTQEAAPVAAQAPPPASNEQPMPAPETAANNNAPAAGAMGVSPAAPVTGEGAIAPNAAAPVDSNDPWAQAAAGAPPKPPEKISEPPQMPAPVAETPTAPPASADAQKLTELQQKLTDLQQKLDQSETARQEQESTIADLQNRLAEAQAKAAKPVAEAAPAKPAAAPAKPKKAAKAEKPKSQDTAATEPAEVQKPASPWELRSASEGVAWVAKNGDNQLYRVAVGDELPGIGRITSVTEQGGGWVVTGTNGQIRQ